MAKNKVKWKEVESSCIKEVEHKAVIGGMKATITRRNPLYWFLNCRELRIENISIKSSDLKFVKKESEGIIKLRIKQQIKFYTKILSKLK